MQMLWIRNRWHSLEVRSGRIAEEDASTSELNTIKSDPMMSTWCGAELCQTARHGRFPESFFLPSQREKIDHIIGPKSALVFFMESLCKRNLLERVKVVQVSLGLEGTKAQMFWGWGRWLLPVFTFYAYFTWNTSFCISKSSHLCIGETSAPHVSRLGFYLPIWGSSHLCSPWLCVQ